MDDSTNVILSNILLSALRDRYNELNTKNYLSYILWSLLAVGILTLLALHFGYRREDILGSSFMTLIPIFLFFWSASMIYLGFKIRELWLYVKYFEKQLDGLVKILTKDKPDFEEYQKGYYSWAALRADYFGKPDMLFGKRGLPSASVLLVVVALSLVYIFTGWRGYRFLLRTDLIHLNFLTATGYAIMLFTFAILLYVMFVVVIRRHRQIKQHLESRSKA